MDFALPGPTANCGDKDGLFPEVGSDRRVTFRLVAPQAREVLVTGEFMKGSKNLDKNEAGVWSVTVGPIEPEIYNYNFTIDGVRTIDPGNPRREDRVHAQHHLAASWKFAATAPAFYDGQPVPHGEIRTHWYQSKSLDSLRRLTVYTPPGYDRGPSRPATRCSICFTAPTPTRTRGRLGRVNLILDNLLAARKIQAVYRRDAVRLRRPAGHVRGRGSEHRTSSAGTCSKT